MLVSYNGHIVGVEQGHGVNVQGDARADELTVLLPKHGHGHVPLIVGYTNIQPIAQVSQSELIPPLHHRRIVDHDPVQLVAQGEPLRLHVVRSHNSWS